VILPSRYRPDGKDIESRGENKSENDGSTVLGMSKDQGNHSEQDGQKGRHNRSELRRFPEGRGDEECP